MSAHLTAGTCQLLELIQVFDEEGGWHGYGISSCAHWLSWKCGMGTGTAREQVRVARALPARRDGEMLMRDSGSAGKAAGGVNEEA